MSNNRGHDGRSRLKKPEAHRHNTACHPGRALGSAQSARPKDRLRESRGPSTSGCRTLMVQVMKGFRVLEVAQFTFVPAAGGILADWGADVIKVEHPVRGDTQRGFINMGGVKLNPNRHTLIEHPNRGKRSVGIDVSTAQGQQLLYEIART